MAKKNLGKGIDRRSFLKTSGVLGLGLTVSGFGVPTLLRAQAKVIKIGQVEPVTGPLAVIGQTMRRAGLLAVEMINSRGGIKSMGGAKLELLLGDSETRPEVGRLEADRLIKDGAVMLAGPFQSDTAMAIATLCEQREIPFVIDVAALDDITQKGYKYTFRCFPSTTRFATNMVSHLKHIMNKAEVQPKTAVVTNVGDSFGKGQSAVFLRVFKESGLPIEILGQFTYPLGVQDLSSEVAKIKAAKPDLIFPVTRPGDSALLVRDLYKQRVPLMAIMSPGAPGWTEVQTLQDLDKLVLYAFNNTIWPNPRSKVFQEATRTYKERHGINIDSNSGFAFMAIQVIAAALEHASSTKPDELVAAMREVEVKDHPMVGGPVKFAANGDNINATTPMLQVHPSDDVHQRVKIVLPEEFAEVPPLFPVPQLWERG